ncbi:MAG TPA: lysylphosphatidylglycerol synthase transmembrane domain-containing protein [Roseiflexaceae bacterium]|nr:lysylphosphatidylglycerol synthase transmembrane domain-containing protein [Roseiflexaceae bacterium]
MISEQPEAVSTATQGDRRGRWWTLIKIMLALGLGAYVFAQVSIAEAERVMRSLSPAWLIGYLLASFAGIVLLSERYRLLIGRQLPFRPILNLVIVQAVIGNLVANVAGIASYITVLRSRYAINIHESVTSLVVSRLGDLLVAGVMLLIATALNWPQVAPAGIVIVVLLLSIGAIFVLVASVLIFRRPVIELAWRMVRFVRLDRISITHRMFSILENLAQQQMRDMIPLMIPVLITSLLIFAASVLSSYCSVQLFAIPVTITQILFMVVLVQLLGLIPIQVFGGLGVFDVAAMFIYGLFGIGPAAIAPVLVGSRIVFYLMNVLLLGYLALDGLRRDD